ncbi:FxSxx-COOH system tetratricopeptide repeat protein [Streptomyces scabiei]|uniref:FxSxx-COOH system tetratricopeptide repeat protein n=1 Tax=Streptomyces scabiei TaxID=1930 RepID=UPI0033F634EE
MVKAEDRELFALLPDAAREPLRAWMAHTKTRLRPVGWSDRGATAAQVIAVYAERRDERMRKLVLKYCPPGDDVMNEPPRHAWAQTHSPAEFFARRLVGQPWEAVELGDNGWIMFQEVAGSLRRYRSLGKDLDQEGFAPGRLVDTCAQIVSCALAEWNTHGPQLAEERTDAPGFLRMLLGVRIAPDGKVDRWAAARPGLTTPIEGGYQRWIRLPGESAEFPHPIVVARDPSLTDASGFLPLVGHGHGDLHLGNVIHPRGEATPERPFRFIDLSNYDPQAPLARDPAHLVLSIVGRTLRHLTSDQRLHLARFLVRPEYPSRGEIPAGLGELAERIRETAVSWAEQYDVEDEWAEQYLLSLIGCGLLFAARRTTREEDREWFFGLAARAGRAYLDDYGRGGQDGAATAGSTEVEWSQATARLTVRASAPDLQAGGNGRLWNVPPLVAHAIQRTLPLSEVRRHMSMTPAGVVVVHGAPGTGKTQLAVDCARRHAAAGGGVAWFSCSRPELLGEQLAELADDFTHNAPADSAAAAGRVFRTLSPAGSWLVVFDDVPDPSHIAPFIASAREAGTGTVITSRSPHFRQLADHCLELYGFEREESVELLRRFLDEVPAQDAEALAASLDHLPLMLAQAGEFMHGSGLTVAAFLKLLKNNRAGLAGSTSTDVALRRLDRESPSAGALLRLCACMAAAPVPIVVLDSGHRHLPPGVVDGPDPLLSLARTVSAAAKSGLLSVGYGQCRLHGFFRTALRDLLSVEETADLTGRARRILAEANPGQPGDLRSWPGYRKLLPHVLETGVVRETDRRCRLLILDLAQYLVTQGDARTALNLAEEAFHIWRAQSGADDSETLAAMSQRARAHFYLGEHQRAVDLDHEVLDRRRQLLGENHPDTLTAMEHLAVSLTSAGRTAGTAGEGLLSRAGELHDTVVSTCLRTLGDDHVETLRARHNHAFHLRTVGDHGGARALEETVYSGLRKIRGEGFPDTLRSAHALAHDLRRAGDRRGARDLQERVMDGYRILFGPDHFETLGSAQALIGDLRRLGENGRARELHTDTLERILRARGPGAAQAG